MFYWCKNIPGKWAYKWEMTLKKMMFCISVLPFIVGDLRYRKGKIEFHCSVYCRNDVQQKKVLKCHCTGWKKK